MNFKSSSTCGFIEELEWKEVRAEVAKVNPQLTHIIDELDPPKDYTLFKAGYSYGNELLQQGELHLPYKNTGLLPLSDKRFPADVQNKLGYNMGSNPVTMVLKNSVELFLILDKSITLYRFFIPGSIIGLWYILNPNSTNHPKLLWNISAGSRSLFMLPKISDKVAHNKLIREFHIDCDAPSNIIDHWEVFSSIAKSPNFANKWQAHVLYFSKKWFNNLDDSAWLKFKNYLLNYAWKNSEYARNNIIWDFIFSIVQKNRHIKPDAYLTNIVEHLLYLAAGMFPGFSPAINDQAGPISKLQEVYLTIYGLKAYAPIIMVPNFFSTKQNSQPVYYSLQHPTAMEFAPKSNKRASTLDYLYLTNSTLSKYKSILSNGKFNLDETILYEALKKTNFDFFHSNLNKPITGIRNSKEMPNEDRFFLDHLSNCHAKEFPVSNTFLNGCVRLSVKDNKN